MNPNASRLACLATPLLLALGTVFAAADAGAVPVFARKYQTSCQTCHVAFPKLTPFGDAFRRMGHRFPAGEDEDSRKEDPVALGQPAHERLFPDSVWPGDLPGAAPIGARFGSQAVWAKLDDRLSFARVGEEIGFNMTGSFGTRFSAWAGAVIRARQQATGAEITGIEIERVFTTVTPFDEPWVMLRIGRFEPGVLGFSLHRMLGPAPWIAIGMVGDNRFTLEPVQLGVEASGVVMGRFQYGLGVVEGNGNLPDPGKDFYGRAGYKLGGMRLDGVGGATETEPWREYSATFAGFAYRGQATLGDPAIATQTDDFTLVGADADLRVRDANLLVAFAQQRNESPMLSMPGVEHDSWHLFGQLDYVVFPWLIPTARFEQRSIAGVQAERYSAGTYVLLRANVRAQVLASAETTSGKTELAQALAGLNVAF